MRTFEEILDRAQLCMIINDRSWCEYKQNKAGTYSKEEREERRLRLIDVLERRNLMEVLSETERQPFFKPVGKLPRELIAYMMGQYAAIPALLWAVGLESFPAFDGTFAGDYHRHPVLQNHRIQGYTAVPPACMPTEADIAFHCDVAMLWHWRGIEGIYNKSIKRTNVPKAVLSVFGQEYAKYLQAIPLTKGLWPDFAIGNRAYKDIDAGLASKLLEQFTWVHHALEWVLGEESWEDIDTST